MLWQRLVAVLRGADDCRTSSVVSRRSVSLVKHGPMPGHGGGVLLHRCSDDGRGECAGLGGQVLAGLGGCLRAPPVGVCVQPPQGGGAGGGGGPLDFLRNQPQFQALRQVVQSNPGILQPMLQASLGPFLQRHSVEEGPHSRPERLYQVQAFVRNHGPEILRPWRSQPCYQVP